jgi:quinone-modifying oxidoreductase, subunit QmoC
MAMRIDTAVLKDMNAYGAFDIGACFNCGNCTAVCPLSKDSDAFPRRMIRYAQLGQREHVVASRELWLCYYCGECSDTCPRQAEPGEFMASARRYAIAGFDPTSLARRLYRSRGFAAAALTAIFAVLVAILVLSSSGVPLGSSTAEQLFKVVPYETIHWMGITVGVVAVLATLATLVNMFWMMSRAPSPGAPGPAEPGPSRFPLRGATRAAGTTLAEVAGHSRYRDCDTQKPQPTLALPFRRWFVHYSIMGGMIGLALATALDYAFKTPGTYVPIWYPPRLLGTIAGAFLVYGATVAIVQRLRKADKYSSHTLQSDWLFLWTLWTLGATGFVLELADYAPLAGRWVEAVLLVHIALAMELILLLPFTKLAHIVYRPVAIWFTEFRRLRAAQ